jgi:hypothetical protein
MSGELHHLSNGLDRGRYADCSHSDEHPLAGVLFAYRVGGFFGFLKYRKSQAG